MTFLIKPLRDNVVDSSTNILLKIDGIERGVLTPADIRQQRVGDIDISLAGNTNTVKIKEPLDESGLKIKEQNLAKSN